MARLPAGTVDGRVTGSVSFDHAAEYYDETRGLTPEGVRAENAMLVGALAGRGRVLEVGVGTGQIALPLHASGIDVIGFDLSRAMLDVLIRKAGGAAPFPLTVGDATSMPFRDAGVDAAYLRWVLHLVTDWRAVVAETVRVVRPTGTIAIHLGDYGDGPTDRIRERFCELAGVDPRPVGLDWGAYDELDAEMAGLGAVVRELPAVVAPSTWTAEAFMRRVEGNAFSWTWPLDDGVRDRAAAETRAWAEEAFGALTEIPREDFDMRWHAYDLP